MSIKPSLPRDNAVNISAFAQLFNSAITSYKFLWTLALIGIVRKEKTALIKKSISVNAVFDRMIEIAEIPLFHFNLFFGVHDKMKERITALKRHSKDEGDAFKIARERIYRELFAYVPYRWLSPFFGDLLRNAGGYTRNQTLVTNKICALADESFNSSMPPPYKFVKRREHIQLHPHWLNYFLANADIIEGWARWNFAKFLQVHNPSMPAIISKIALPEKRVSLDSQRKFWREVMAHSEVTCIYSGERIDTGDFELDHYIPKTFIGHDNLWNLIPVIPEINSSKGNILPSDKYMAGLTERQHRALHVHNRHFPRRYTKLTDCYMADLRLSQKNLLDEEIFKSSYEMLVSSLIALAKANQFKHGWHYHVRIPI